MNISSDGFGATKNNQFNIKHYGRSRLRRSPKKGVAQNKNIFIYLNIFLFCASYYSSTDHLRLDLTRLLRPMPARIGRFASALISNRKIFSLRHPFVLGGGAVKQKDFAMCPDLERYRPYLASQNLTRAQEDQFIHTLYAALEKLADRQFGMDAVSLAADANALADSFDDASMPDCNGVTGHLPECAD